MGHEAPILGLSLSVRWYRTIQAAQSPRRLSIVWLLGLMADLKEPPRPCEPTVSMRGTQSDAPSPMVAHSITLYGGTCCFRSCHARAVCDVFVCAMLIVMAIHGSRWMASHPLSPASNRSVLLRGTF